MAYISFQPSGNYKTHLYNGTGSSQAVTGLGFQPDVVWMKNRIDTRNHNLFDALRGVFMNLIVNTDAAEASATNSLTSFDSDGFTVQDSNETNEAGGDGYANWNWRMGTTTGIAGSPSITPTSYSFNAAAGQSIIRYTGNAVAGATVPHGLGVAPDLIVAKTLDSSWSWPVYHVGMGATKYVYLDSTQAVLTDTTKWNDTAPTSTLFSLGTSGAGNASGDDYVAYCFASLKGYSKMGSFIGNANADGPFIFTGFRPAFVMIKNISAVEAWNLWNDKTSTSGKNVADKNVQPNSSAAEQTSVSGVKEIDLVSNGFKVRGSNTELNGSGNTLIYAAFAEFPIVSSNSKAGVAR